MADNRGISGKALRALDTPQGAPPFILNVATVAGTSSYTLVDYAEFPFRVIDAWSVATAAGASGDTWKVSTTSGDVTDTVSIASAGDRDIVRAAEVNDANQDVAKGDAVTVTTASGALAQIYVLCVRITG